MKKGSKNKSATFDDYADCEFEALVVNIEQARATYNSRWFDLAIALGFLTKSHVQCRDVIEHVETEEKGDEILTYWIDELIAMKSWLETTRDVVDGGLVKLLCGMSRLHKERGFTEDLEA